MIASSAAEAAANRAATNSKLDRYFEEKNKALLFLSE